MPDLDDLLRKPEAARLAGRSTATLDRWRAERKIGYWRYGGRIYFSARDIRALLASGRVDPVDEKARDG